MKPFNLEEYIANPNKKLITRDGRKVTRILCTDAKGSFPIIALIETYNNSEYPYTFTKEGKDSPGITHSNDLFFAPEKHEGWINVYKWGENYRYTGDVFSSKEKALMGVKGCDGVATIKIEWEE